MIATIFHIGLVMWAIGLPVFAIVGLGALLCRFASTPRRSVMVGGAIPVFVAVVMITAHWLF